ncbi:MAG TPA: hypothetical protein VI007_10230 [bacterium]
MAENRATLGIIGRDVTWEQAKGIDWLMTTMIPQARVDEHGRIRDAGWLRPYAMLHLHAREGDAFLEVTHKVDFLHIWEAWQRQQRDGGEVVVNPNGPGGVRARLTVYLVPTGAYAVVSAPGFRAPNDPEQLRALSPIQTWTWG